MGTNATQTGAAQWIEENVVNVELLWALMSQRSERCLYIKHLTRKYRPVFVCGCTIITLPKTFTDSLFVCLFIFTFLNHLCKFYFLFLCPDDQKNIWGFQRSIKMEKMRSSLMSLWQCTTVKISNHQQQPIRWSRGNVLLSSYRYSVRTFVQWRSLISGCLNIYLFHLLLTLKFLLQ